jgi:O6-methylguanine-DNA--protein-cysteine methyltransferase
MAQDDFEEKYLDVLQNIEFGIVSVYREHPEMLDWDAFKAVEALI